CTSFFSYASARSKYLQYFFTLFGKKLNFNAVQTKVFLRFLGIEGVRKQNRHGMRRKAGVGSL
ncbi:hypothetical protein, partial [Dyadobacter frigoris]|uniref:hypothetical protein n=1 Tax=Dyadobacter frigoris TaxID=2576211 RepID=UPI002553709F